MAKSVLGNDPFVRGAAPRPPIEPIPLRRVEPLQGPSKALEEVTLREPQSRATSVESIPRERALAISHKSGPLTQRLLGLASGIATAVSTGLGLGSTQNLDEFGKDEGLEQALGPVTDLLYRKYFRVSVEGAVRVPKGQVILVANHAGAIPLDGPVIQYALRQERPELLEARWLLEDQIFHAPFWGMLLNRLGAVRASPENALRLLNDGRPVIVFPEGILGISKQFQDRYKLKRFGRGGFAKLALHAKVPVVPVAVVGSEETTPLLAKLPIRLGSLPYLPLSPLGTLPLPAKWTLRFGEPIDGSALNGRPDDPRAVEQLADRTKAAIQTLLNDTLLKRRSAFLG